MNIIKYTILAFLILTVSEACFAKNGDIRFQKLNTADGLNSNVVYELFQDSHGFIWIGTKEGINRYDGYTITSYPLPSKFYKNISNQRINSISEDQMGRIWLGTPYGIIQMDAFTGKMLHYTLPYQKNAYQSQYVNAISISYKNEIWVGTQNGLYFFDQQKNTFKQYPYFPFNSKSASYPKGERLINDLCFDKDQNLWIATAGNGLTILDINLKKKRIFIPSKRNPKASVRSKHIVSIFKDSRGVMWLATTNGLSQYSPKDESFLTYRHSDKNKHSLLDNNVLAIAEDLNGQLWVGGKKGLDRFDHQGNKFHHYQNHPLHSESISSNTILSLLADRSGNFWAGSSRGVSYFSSHSLHFDLYQNIPDNSNSLIDNTLRSIVAHPSGKLWIGSLKDGINSFDQSTGIFSSYRMEYGTKRRNKHNAIRTAYVGKDSSLFFGTDGGVLLYNQKKDCFENFDAYGVIPFKKGVFEIMQDQEGYYWFAEIAKGLWKWHPKTGESQLYKKKSGTGLISTNLKVVRQSSNGDIWVGSHMKGLSRLPSGKNGFISYIKEELGGISDNRVYDIFEDSKKQLWIGTGNGLNRYNEDEDSFEVYDLKDGLAGRVILSIQEDDLGRLWLGTNNGLSCFDVEKGQVANFYHKDGLQGNIFEYKVACKHQGQLFFGGNNGLNAFYPKDFKMNIYTPKLKFVQVKSSNGSVNIIRGEKNTEKRTPWIEIKNSDQNIIIEIASDSYVETYKNRFSYKVLPQDSIWKMIPFSHNEIHLSDLSIGDHTLQIKSSNNHMKWNPKISTLQIEVNRDWSKATSLFYMFLFASGLALIFWLTKSKIKLWLSQKQNKQKDTKKSPTKSSLNRVSTKIDSQWLESTDQLNSFMKGSFLYRDKRLTKGQLAKAIGWTEIQLSNTLRDGLETNFNDFVNTFRVEEVKERLKDPQSRDFTLIAIAEECGFNSKTSFYRTFKKFTDQTPSEYLEQINLKP